MDSEQYFVSEMDYELKIWWAAKVLANIAQGAWIIKIVLKRSWQWRVILSQPPRES